MQNFLSLLTVAPKMDTGDYVGFTFFVGTMAMMAASAFFFLSMNTFLTGFCHICWYIYVGENK